MPEAFREMLKRLRLRAGMSQEDLWRRSGVSVRTIGALESNPRRNATMGTLRNLADALQLEGAERDAFFAAADGRVSQAPPPGPGTAGSPHGEGAAPGPLLVQAAARLAEQVKARWQEEEEHPVALPIRWDPMPAEQMAALELICGSQSGEAIEPLALGGQLEDIAEVYRRIPSGRLMVVGRAGAGKTILTLRFVSDMLKSRAPGDPVPVIFDLGSWQPDTTHLRSWLTAQLLHDYPTPDPEGPRLAASLVNEGFILPVLDGFDEIADNLRESILGALNRSRMPLLMTSREAEYLMTVAEVDVLSAAAGIQLADVTLADLNKYLPLTTRKTINGTPLWSTVLAELNAEPRSRAADDLAAVLSTPLMIYLARIIYSSAGSRDPAELLERFDSAKDIESHLLGTLVPTVYRAPQAKQDQREDARQYPLEDVQRWLGYLAHHMNLLDTRDLAWWQLGSSMRRRARMVIVALVVAVVFALTDIAMEGLLLGLSTPYLAVTAAAIGIVVGAAFGLVHGLIAGHRGRTIEPSRVRLRIRRPKALPWPEAAHRFRTGFAGGFVTGIGYGIVRAAYYTLMFDLETAQLLLSGSLDALAFGLIFGLAAGFTLGLVALSEVPLDTESVSSPEELLRADRRTRMVQVLVLGSVFAAALPFFGWGLVTLLQQLPSVQGIGFNWDPLFGLLIGLIGGIGGAVSYTLGLTAWGQWLVFGRFWLPLTGRLPWALPAFLKGAYHRGVLRRAGAVYRFRHERLQDHLAAEYRSGRN